MIERNYPWIIAAIAIVMVFKFSGFIVEFDKLIPALTQSALTISATLLGFLLTILTIINSITTRRMNFVKTGGAYPTLLSYLSKAIVSNIVVTIFSLIELFFNRPKINIKVLLVTDYCYIFAAFLSIMLTFRFAFIFVQLLADKKDSD